MARVTRVKNMKDGFYIEVRNNGSQTGIKIHRDTREQLEAAVEQYSRSKEVVILGEVKDGKLHALN